MLASHPSLLRPRPGTLGCELHPVLLLLLYYATSATSTQQGANDCKREFDNERQQILLAMCVTKARSRSDEPVGYNSREPTKRVNSTKQHNRKLQRTRPNQKAGAECCGKCKSVYS